MGRYEEPFRGGISIHALLAESDSRPKALKSLRCVFLSTLSLRRATFQNQILVHHNLFLSTLSLRRATERRWKLDLFVIFLSTLSLRRATAMWFTTGCPMLKFLSTLSLRRATKVVVVVPSGFLYFYPRSPCGERQPIFSEINTRGCISIHALLAESDNIINCNSNSFQEISIHALLAESDNECTSFAPNPKTFLSTLSLRRATHIEHLLITK